MNDEPDDILDLDDDHVFGLYTTDLSIRSLLDNSTGLSDALIEQLDGAQAYVFTGKGETAYVVIKIKKEKEADA